MNVTVTPGKFGENTTIEITAPVGVNEVNVTVDNVTYTVPIGPDGKGNKTLNNLSAGKHEVIVDAGNENYTDKHVSKTFDIDKATPAITIDVEHNVDAGSDVLINVTIDKNATGQVNIQVDGKDHLVTIKDGKANYTELNVQPGVHTIVVTYSVMTTIPETLKRIHSKPVHLKLKSKSSELKLMTTIT